GAARAAVDDAGRQRARQVVDQPGDLLPLVAEHPQPDAVRGQAASDRCGGVAVGGPSGMQDDQDLARRHRGPSATARSSATSPTSSALMWRASRRKYSTLPDGPGSGLATAPRST